MTLDKTGWEPESVHCYVKEFWVKIIRYDKLQ